VPEASRLEALANSPGVFSFFTQRP
jgi:hypothetical protein